MKPFEIFSAVPQRAEATPDAILDSPAFLAPCRIGDDMLSLRRPDVQPDESGMLALSIAFGDEPHELLLAPSPRFPELGKIWDARADVPEPVLLALAEKECGAFFQMLENVVRRQMKLNGIASASGEQKVFLGLSDGSLSFALTRSVAVVSALGVLRNLDLGHESIRSRTLPCEYEYAAFAADDAELAALASGDAVLLPEIGSIAPRIVVDGRFVADANGVSHKIDDALAHVFAAAPGEITLGELFDAQENPAAVASPAQGSPLKIVKGGRPVASGRLDSLSGQPAFIMETS